MQCQARVEIMTNSKHAYYYIENAKEKSLFGHYQDAINDYTKAINLLSQVRSKEKEDFVDYEDYEEAYKEKAWLHILLEEYDKALVDLKKIIALKKELKDDSLDETFSINNLQPSPEMMLIGLCKYQLEDYESAKSYLTKAIELYKLSPSLQDWNSYQLGYCYILRGETAYILGERRKAYEDWKIALDLDGLAQALKFETPQQSPYPDDFEDWIKSYGLPMIAKEFKKYCINI